MQHIDTFDFHDNLEDCHDCIKFYKYSDNCDDADACVKGFINREIYMDPRPAPGYSGWYCDPQPGQPDCMDDGAITGLARTLLHEAGHLLYDLEDEYERNDDNTTTGCCGHSVMSQSTRPMDFCTDGVHESEDQPPGCVAWPWEPDNWTHHWDERGIPLPRRRFPEYMFPDPELYVTATDQNGWPYSQFMTFNGF